MKNLAWCLIPLMAAACATESDPCAEMSAKIKACFPEVATIEPTCDPAAAEQVDNLSCDQLAAQDGKADGWSCVWMPWLPSCSSGGGGGSSASGKTIEVSTEECGPGALCPYVQSSSCGLVTLHKGAQEVARGITTDGGRFTFSGLAAGEYTVKVHKRDNTMPKMFVSQYTDETAPASLKLTVGGSGEEPWARFSLQNGSSKDMNRCAGLEGDLKVKTKAGAAVDRHAVEWAWVEEIERNGVVIERLRPLFIWASNGAQERNVLAFRGLQAGDYTVRLIPVDVPEYKQKPNPDYAELVERYATDNVEPIEFAVKITAAQASGKTVTFNKTITDPRL